MFQAVVNWNHSRPDQESKHKPKHVTLRGYNAETYLTGEFVSKLNNKKIRPLSVSNIVDRLCPTRRDLYFYKGAKKLQVQEKRGWAQKAGYVVETYIHQTTETRRFVERPRYHELIRMSNTINEEFVGQNGKIIEELKQLESTSFGSVKGDTDWLLSLLDKNVRVELGLSFLHSLLKEDDSLELKHIEFKRTITPDFLLGISSPAVPDYIIPRFGVVGDIKSGIEFKPYFQLTCAGYALAYESANGKDQDINWGMVYFIPTRNPSAYVKPLTLAQIYIFPIDDHLRQWFLDSRDEAYNLISKGNPPRFPIPEQREQCYYCKFKDYCASAGLKLK